MINYVSNTSGYLDVTFGPKWDYIPVTRTYIENFLKVNMLEQADIDRIEVAASELLENAVKYSDKDGIRVIMNKSKNAKKIELLVYNYLNKKNYMELEEKIKAMKKEDSFAYYIEAMKKSVDDEATGLGLARIYHETGAKLSLKFLKKFKVVEMKAIFSVNIIEEDDEDDIEDNMLL